MVSTIANGNQSVYPFMIPDTLSTIKAIHKERCTAIKAAPTIFMDLIGHHELLNHDLSCLESMLIGATTVPKDLLIKVKETLKLKNVIVGYAMTETGCAGILTKASDINVSEKVAYESIGRNVINEVKIRDPLTNQIVPRNTDGEICIKGYSIMREYYDEPEKTKETIDKNGWLLTGENEFNIFEPLL